MKKIIFTLIVTAELLFGGLKNTTINYAELDKIPASDLASAMANEMTKSMHLPLQIDYLTELVSMISYNKMIMITKVVDIKHPDMKAVWRDKKDAFINVMLKQDSNSICHNEVWHYMIYNRGIIPQFDYKDQESRILFRYTVEKEDCEKLSR